MFWQTIWVIPQVLRCRKDGGLFRRVIRFGAGRHFMSNEIFSEDFRKRVTAVVTRFLAQNGLASLGEAEFRALATELASPVAEICRGKDELPDEVVKAGVARLLAIFSPPRPELANLAKQLIKGCHQSDHAQCRESYHETDAAGRCRRQELDYDRTRVSGAHCVDCPYWRKWEPEEHAARLTAEWHDGPAAFAAHREVFLPEDFRALRLLAQSCI